MHLPQREDAEQTIAKKRTEHHSWVREAKLPDENGPAKPECGVESNHIHFLHSGVPSPGIASDEEVEGKRGQRNMNDELRVGGQNTGG